MMRRYLGRATGYHRRAKKFPLFWVLAISVPAMGLVLVAVFLFNPGANIPEEERGSVAPSLVLPASTSESPAPSE